MQGTQCCDFCSLSSTSSNSRATENRVRSTVSGLVALIGDILVLVQVREKDNMDRV